MVYNRQFAADVYFNDMQPSFRSVRVPEYTCSAINLDGNTGNLAGNIAEAWFDEKTPIVSGQNSWSLQINKVRKKSRKVIITSAIWKYILRLYGNTKLLLTGAQA